MTITAAADGSALGNPGPAGWGWYADEQHWACGGWSNGTNNMGELMAVLDLLQQTAHLDEDLHVICDSTYVINSITKWMAGWKRRGWKKGDGKPVMNVELMKALDEAMQGRRVTFEWVKGHAGHHLNEQADRLANAAATSWKGGSAPSPGPGFAGSATTHPAAAPGQVEEEPDLFAAFEDVVADASDEQVVISLERSLLSDEVRSDSASVAALLHPQWQEIGASGRLWSRDEVLAEIGPLGGDVGLDVVDVQRLSDDLVLLVWRSLRDDATVLRSSLWQRVSGRWLQRFHQGTVASG